MMKQSNVCRINMEALEGDNENGLGIMIFYLIDCGCNEELFGAWWPLLYMGECIVITRNSVVIFTNSARKA